MKVKNKKIIKKKVESSVKCLCEISFGPCSVDNCLCPYHFINRKEWEKHVIKVIKKRVNIK